MTKPPPLHLRAPLPYYWAQPDAGRHGDWTVCMNPDDPGLIIDGLKKEEADSIVGMMADAAGETTPQIVLRPARPGKEGSK